MIAYGYVLTCPLGWITRPLRLQWFGEGAVAPPRHRMPSLIMPSPDDSDDSDDPEEETDEGCDTTPQR